MAEETQQSVIDAAVAAARAKWDAVRTAEIATKEAEERNRTCLEAITPLFHEHQGVVYTPLATTQTFKIDGVVMTQLKETQFSRKWN